MGKKISQRQLDLEAFERGRARYYKNLKRTMDKGRESDTNWGSRMTESAILPFAARLVEVLDTDMGVGATLLRSLELDPNVIALLAFKTLLDGTTKQKTFSRSCIETARVVQGEAMLVSLKAVNTDRLELYKNWVKMRDNRGKIRDLKRIMSYRFSDLVERFSWSDEEALRVGYVLAMTACESTGLLQKVTYRKGPRNTISTLTLTDEAWDYAHKAMKHSEALHPVKLPMVVPPRKWVNANDGGYEQGLGDSLVRGATKTARESHTKEAMPLVYDAINVIQFTPFRVNKAVLEAATAVMEGRLPVGDLDVHAVTPLPERPAFLDSAQQRTEDEKAIARRYFMDCSRIVDDNRRITSRRLAVIQTINLAQKFASEDDLRFFHAAALDFRGRFYCQATGLSHQGSDLQRGLIDFGLGHVVPHDSEALQAWLRHGAAVYGTKGTLEERAAFSSRLIQTGEPEAIAKDPLGTAHLWGRTAEPFSYLAWCLDVPRVRIKKPSHLMVAVDGSCNGLQVLSLLLRDEVGGAAVNLLPASRPSDIYQMVADRSMERVRAAAAVGEMYAAEWASIGVSRAMVKRPVMCLPYSISPRSAMMYLKDAYYENHRNGPWIDPSKPCGFLIRKVWPSIGDIVLKGSEFLAWARAAGRIITNAGIHPMWVTPDGFTVQQSYYSYGKSKVRTTLGVQSHIWQIRKQTSQINGRKHVSGLVPNLVHSLDATAARTTARRLHAAGVPDMAFVHDSYLCHAAFQPTLARELREAWIDTSAGDPLNDWVRQIEAQLPVGVKLPPPPAYGNLDPKCIRDSKYFFS